jgi:hypothetical protein
MLVWDCQCVCVRINIVSPNKPAILDMKATCPVPVFDSSWLPHLAERIGDTLLKLENVR